MHLNIGWLFPNLLSTYGDRGNLICLQRRAEWRGIHCTLVSLDEHTSIELWKEMDLYVGGGAQDRQQAIVMRNLLGSRGEILTEKIKNSTPALFTCAFFQLLGRDYKSAEGKCIQGLGLLDFTTVHQGFEKPRCVGNAILKITATTLCNDLKKIWGHVPYLVGYENHGGCTYLNGVEPLASIIKGHGNNQQDKTEGVFYKKVIGTYLHGPLLPKNPFLADWLIEKAMQQKYQIPFSLKPLEEEYVSEARRCVASSARPRKSLGFLLHESSRG
jgi:CobQ-like glutamine amidotransferase family enzyme